MSHETAIPTIQPIDPILNIPTSIPQLPKLWYFDCKYCKSQRKWGSDHESEIMDKARRFCTNPTNHFEDMVYARLDTLDHSACTPTQQYHILGELHVASGCHCQDKTIQSVQERIRGNQDHSDNPCQLDTTPNSDNTGQPEHDNPCHLSQPETDSPAQTVHSDEPNRDKIINEPDEPIQAENDNPIQAANNNNNNNNNNNILQTHKTAKSHNSTNHSNIPNPAQLRAHLTKIRRS